MSLLITQRPSSTSKFATVANPVLYKMIRKDYLWTLLVTSGGKIQITIAGNFTANFVAGGICWLQSNDGAYSLRVTVFSSAFGGGNTTVVFNEAYVANNAAGYVNTLSNRPNYYVGVELYNGSTLALLFSQLTISPSNIGLVTIDVSSIVASFLSPDNNGDYVTRFQTAIDSLISQSIYIKYTEFWTGSANAQTDDVANKFYGVLAARQVGKAPYGATLAEYVNFDVTTFQWVSRTPAFSDQWRSVTYGNGLFVAVCNEPTNGVMTSPDGINWTGRLTSLANPGCVTFGNGIFVAISSNAGLNQAATSPDGINWTLRSTAIARVWLSVVYGNGLFVAVSNAGGPQVMTSPDGINWISRASPSRIWVSVTYGAGLFVAIASDAPSAASAVMTSPDGINWTLQAPAVQNWQCVTFGNGLFVAVATAGAGNRVMTSPDGINWTARVSALDNRWFGVAYGNGLFVAVAAAGGGGVDDTKLSMTSPDGINWTALPTPTIDQWIGIVYGANTFVATAITGSGHEVMTAAFGGGVTKFLTPFDRPKLWKGYPFSLSAIFSETMATSPFFDLTYLNAAGGIVAHVALAANAAYKGNVVRLDPEQIYKSNVSAVMNPTIVSILIRAMVGASITSEDKYIDVIDASQMKNVVNVWWRNTLGGDSWWVFDFSQDMNFKYQGSSKNKRLTLIEDSCTNNEWDSIQELCTLGEIFQPPIIELLSSTNKIQQRIRAQAYLIDAAGVKTGIIVIPNDQTTFTRRIRHTLRILVELPETITQ